MIKGSCFRMLALLMAFLVISLPVAFASELNLQYDANGNLVTGDSFYREYNELNQLVVVREGNTSSGQILQEYLHHPVEERILVKRVYENGILNQKIIYVNDNFVQIKNASGVFNETYVYQDDILVAKKDTDGNKFAMHPDHLGSTDTVSDAGGNIVEQNFYSPFGEQLEFGGSRFGYEGKEYDSQTKDTDFHFRKYKPQWGKFTQPDTLIQDVYDPQLLNRYAFERNNPLINTDPTGHLIPALIARCAASKACTLFVVGVMKLITNQGKSDKLAQKALDLELDVEYNPDKEEQEQSSCQEDFSNHLCAINPKERKTGDNLPTAEELAAQASLLSTSGGGGGGSGGGFFTPRKPEEADEAGEIGGGGGGSGGGFFDRDDDDPPGGDADGDGEADHTPADGCGVIRSCL